MEYQTILYEVRNQIAYVTLNRPESMNAINRQMTGNWSMPAGRSRTITESASRFSPEPVKEPFLRVWI